MPRRQDSRIPDPDTFTKAEPSSYDLPATDLWRWRLKGSEPEGVHHWLYLSEEKARSVPQTFAEKYFLGLPTASSLPLTGSSAIDALNFGI